MLPMGHFQLQAAFPNYTQVLTVQHLHAGMCRTNPEPACFLQLMAF
jgi:hypothetical protein